MRSLRGMAMAATVICGALLTGGCPLPTNTVRVEIINDTDFDVQPNVVFDEDDGFFGSFFPGDELDTGLIAPGDSFVFDFDCDALGSIASDGGEQVLLFDEDVIADSTSTLQRDEDFVCGDIITFTFVGNGADFGVNVSVNGRIVD
ncbi:MAG: hypothetical protein ACKVS9_07395 [Phycisphaerae bacterium]